MNRSGRAVKSLADFYKINLDDLWLLHDDLALPLGALRLSQNAGPAGHKGVQSVIETLGTKNFGRWRLGIAPMKKNFLFSFWQKLQPAEKFVLQKFTADETPLVQSAIQKASDALNIALQESFSQAQTRFN
jgi:PTH1 family peptidyl-tRNA hydrolase